MSLFRYMKKTTTPIILRELRKLFDENMDWFNNNIDGMKEVEKTSNASADEAKAAKVESSQAKAQSQTAETKADSTQSQVDTLVLENGDSSAEVSTARGSYSVLRERFEANEGDLSLARQDLDDRGVNLLLLNAEGDGVTDDTEAFNNANNLQTTIYLPPGEYVWKEAMVDLKPGTHFVGAGKDKTTIIVDTEDADYFIRTNRFTGFRGIEVRFKNTFTGDCLLHDVGYISASNDNSPHHMRNQSIGDLVISFPYRSGRGKGLAINITNYDRDGNVYTTDVNNNLVYFFVGTIEVRYGEAMLDFYANQRDDVVRAVWATTSAFDMMFSISCRYGIKMVLDNESTTRPETFGDLVFNNTKIQCASPGFLESTEEGTLALYIKGLPDRKIDVVLNNFTNWDSASGISGYLENCNVVINNFFAGYAVHQAAGYKEGFEMGSGASLELDTDRSYYHTDVETGEYSRNQPIPGGWNGASDVFGANGFNARYEIYQERPEGSTSSTDSLTVIKNYDKNGSVNALIELGRYQGEGVMSAFAKDPNGALVPIFRKGHNNLNSAYYTNDKMLELTQGGNLVYERHDVTMEQTASYNILNVPINATFDSAPFALSCALERVDGGVSSTDYDVFIRQYYTTEDGFLRVVLKHNKPGAIDLRFRIVLLGFKKHQPLTSI